MESKKIELDLIPDEDDDVLYVEPSFYKENKEELLVPLTAEEEEFTASNRISLYELFYKYMFWITGDDETHNQQAIAEFKEEILYLIDEAYAEDRKDAVERGGKMQAIAEMLNDSQDKTD